MSRGSEIYLWIICASTSVYGTFEEVTQVVVVVLSFAHSYCKVLDVVCE